ncbi:hypothetical protein RINTU1_23670 [Candidatus Regiella insecticola]|uniref:Uncharacterized protein n=1 Tax=Candidatus Regiella insecticola TaxID=138073 RepID=A0A6L2ZQF8_9ENTR|nr:hypothetical protein RINTU1_23670 [Candidatus Regiella insecticola]
MVKMDEAANRCWIFVITASEVELTIYKLIQNKEVENRV